MSDDLVTDINRDVYFSGVNAGVKIVVRRLSVMRRGREGFSQEHIRVWSHFIVAHARLQYNLLDTV